MISWWDLVSRTWFADRILTRKPIRILRIEEDIVALTPLKCLQQCKTKPLFLFKLIIFCIYSYYYHFVYIYICICWCFVGWWMEFLVLLLFGSVCAQSLLQVGGYFILLAWRVCFSVFQFWFVKGFDHNFGQSFLAYVLSLSAHYHKWRRSGLKCVDKFNIVVILKIVFNVTVINWYHCKTQMIYMWWGLYRFIYKYVHWMALN